MLMTLSDLKGYFHTGNLYSANISKNTLFITYEYNYNEMKCMKYVSTVVFDPITCRLS